MLEVFNLRLQPVGVSRHHLHSSARLYSQIAAFATIKTRVNEVVGKVESLDFVVWMRKVFMAKA